MANCADVGSERCLIVVFIVLDRRLEHPFAITDVIEVLNICSCILLSAMKYLLC